MRKLLNKPWFVALLAIAAVAFVWNSLRDSSGSRSRRHASVATAGIVANEIEESTADAAPATLREALLALVIPARLSDPFAPRNSTTTAIAAGPALPNDPDLVETVHLSAVWAQHGDAFVLVNDRICQTGDAIGRLTIESATLDGVWFTHWKGRDFVRVGGDFTLVTPAHQPANPALVLNER